MRNSNFGILFLHRLMVIAKVFFSVLFKESVETEKGKMRLNGPARLRLFLETVGGGFVKFGQTLVLFHEVLPPEYAEEMLIIKNKAPELPFRIMNGVFYKETGRWLEDLFLELDQKPLASTTTAQIYKGKLHSGEVVTIKIQRPYIKEIMEADYGVISFLLHTLGLFGLISLKRVEEILSYFVSWSRKSLDFITEAKNADILYQHNLKHSSSIIPKQYLEFCTSRVITQEFIADTISLEDVIKYKKEEGGLAEGIDALGVVECFLNDELREYLIDGFFHATPHSSNLVFTKDFTTVHLDFGIIGEASGKRTILLGILKNISQKDTEGFCKHIFEFGSKILQDEMEYYLKADLTKRRQEEKILEKIKESIFEDFKKDAGDILNNWFVYLDHKDASIKDKMAIYTFAKIFGKLAAYGIYLPREINLFLRAIFLIDFIGLVTSEKYNLVNSLADFFTRYPQETLERYIVTGEYSGEIRQKLIPMAEMDWEFFKESAASEKERIMAARERIAELIAYYGEKYEEIGSMIKKIN